MFGSRTRQQDPPKAIRIEIHQDFRSRTAQDVRHHREGCTCWTEGVDEDKEGCRPTEELRHGVLEELDTVRELGLPQMNLQTRMAPKRLYILVKMLNSISIVLDKYTVNLPRSPRVTKLGYRFGGCSECCDRRSRWVIRVAARSSKAVYIQKIPSIYLSTEH